MTYHPFSMFSEPDTDPPKLSMTRTVAFLFTLTVCYALVVMARNNHAHDVGWPMCAIAIATLLAVPLQALCKYLQVWFTSSPGQSLLRSLLAKFQATATGAVPSITSTATQKTEVGNAATEDKS